MGFVKYTFILIFNMNSSSLRKLHSLIVAGHWRRIYRKSRIIIIIISQSLSRDNMPSTFQYYESYKSFCLRDRRTKKNLREVIEPSHALVNRITFSLLVSFHHRCCVVLCVLVYMCIRMRHQWQYIMHASCNAPSQPAQVYEPILARLRRRSCSLHLQFICPDSINQDLNFLNAVRSNY